MANSIATRATRRLTKLVLLAAALKCVTFAGGCHSSEGSDGEPCYPASGCNEQNYCDDPYTCSWSTNVCELEATPPPPPSSSCSYDDLLNAPCKADEIAESCSIGASATDSTCRAVADAGGETVYCCPPCTPPDYGACGDTDTAGFICNVPYVPSAHDPSLACALHGVIEQQSYWCCATTAMCFVIDDGVVECRDASTYTCAGDATPQPADGTCSPVGDAGYYYCCAAAADN